jgi:hypothetical protein
MWYILGLGMIGCAVSSNDHEDIITSYRLLEWGEYSWTCHDYEEWTEVIVETDQPCNDEVLYDYVKFEAGYILTSGLSSSRVMAPEGACVYGTSFLLEDEICMQLADVTVGLHYVSR